MFSRGAREALNSVPLGGEDSGAGAAGRGGAMLDARCPGRDRRVPIRTGAGDSEEVTMFWNPMMSTSPAGTSSPWCP